MGTRRRKRKRARKTGWSRNTRINARWGRLTLIAFGSALPIFKLSEHWYYETAARSISRGATLNCAIPDTSWRIYCRARTSVRGSTNIVSVGLVFGRTYLLNPTKDDNESTIPAIAPSAPNEPALIMPVDLCSDCVKRRRAATNSPKSMRLFAKSLFPDLIQFFALCDLVGKFRSNITIIRSLNWEDSFPIGDSTR